MHLDDHVAMAHAPRDVSNAKRGRGEGLAGKMEPGMERWSALHNKAASFVAERRVQSATNADFPRFRNVPVPFATVSTPSRTTTRPRTIVVTDQPVTSMPSYGV